MTKIIDAFKNLSDDQRTHVLFSLLVDKSIDYIELSNAYVKALQKQQEVESKKLYKSSLWLSMVWQYIPKHKKLYKAASAFAIIQSGVVRGAKAETDYKGYLEENPYTEDEYGFPKSELK